MAQAPSAAPLVTMAEVRSALSAQGLLSAEAEIAPLPAVGRKQAAIALRVAEVEGLAGNRARVRLRCRNGSECLPFYAELRWPSAAAKAAALNVFAQQPQPQPVHQPPFTMKIGTEALLLVEAEHSEMEIPVISLQNGRAGSVIRVTSSDHKQIYRAEILSGSVLRMRTP